MATYPPVTSFGSKISKVQCEIAVVNKIRVKCRCWNSLEILWYKSKRHIQDIPPFSLSRTISNGTFILLFILTYLDWRSFCLCTDNLLFRSRSYGFTLHVIIIRVYNHTLFYGHRNIKTIGIFYQDHVFSLKSCHNTAPYLTKETDFISYFHTLFFFS